MRLSFALLLPLVLVLSACATPRERCMADATRELRTIDALIAETEGNIARGYAILREPAVRTTLVWCLAPDDRITLCNRQEADVRERPVAIDRAEERRKLASLRERRAELLREAAAAQARCAALHPA